MRPWDQPRLTAQFTQTKSITNLDAFHISSNLYPACAIIHRKHRQVTQQEVPDTRSTCDPTSLNHASASAQLEMAHQANLPTIRSYLINDRGVSKWTHLFWRACFEVAHNRQSVELDWFSIPALCTIKSWQDMTWNSDVLFFLFIWIDYYFIMILALPSSPYPPSLMIWLLAILGGYYIRQRSGF